MQKQGIAEKITKLFIDSKITPLIIVGVMLIGIFAVVLTPKEEDPQIVVPMIDIFVPYPGANAKEVEKRVTFPLEKIMWEIPGVKYVYSTAKNGMGMVIVRFKVGMDEEKAIVKLYTKIRYNMDRMPQGVMPPLIKSMTINQVPQLAITFYSKKYNEVFLRRIAAEVGRKLSEIKGVAQCTLTGGIKGGITIEPDLEKIKRFHVDIFSILKSLQGENYQAFSSNLSELNKNIHIKVSNYFHSLKDIENVVVAINNGKVIYLKDVANIYPFNRPRKNYVETYADNTILPAVTLSIAKKKGFDTVVVCDKILEKLKSLKSNIIPDSVKYQITRDYGKSALDKVKTLLEHLSGAIISVLLVVAIFIGLRAGIVTFITVPVTFALTLFIYYLFGYTLNRVTLFALIFVTGIVVDDAIIVVENIERHLSLKGKLTFDDAIKAVGEVGNPTILATLTVIIAIYPMAFVRGLMGPYMKPMPEGATLSMIFSLLIALTIAPWLTMKLLPKEEKEKSKSLKLYNVYKSIFNFLLNSKLKSFLFLLIVFAMFIGSILFIPSKAVVMKMLPFDNKNEIQVVIDMPTYTTLEQTHKVAKILAYNLEKIKEVKGYQIYTGTSSPFNFNGLVRHYYLRKEPYQADIAVNLVDKSQRTLKSHDIAKKIRTVLDPVAKKFGARIKIAEIPPGPPVLSTLVAEVYGDNDKKRLEIARKVKDIFQHTKGVVDIDWYVEDNVKEYRFLINKIKAAKYNVPVEKIVKTLKIYTSGIPLGLFHVNSREPENIKIILPEKDRNSINTLKNLNIMSLTGKLVPLSELVTVKVGIKSKPIYHKNLKKVTYVIADVAGKEESPVYAILKMMGKIEKLNIKQYFTSLPDNTFNVSMKWDGEWQVTYEVFRDLGIAFAVVLVILYLILAAWFKSYINPIIMMIPIPLTLIGILPGHYIFHKFFTATSMIGFIALAGIMVRNSILLIDFIEIALSEGKSLKQAVIEGGAIRTRPVVLTSLTVVIGALFMLPDPIFSGLGVSMMTGTIVSTILTLIVVPLIYFWTGTFLRGKK